MTDKELRRLNRKQLLEMMIEQSRENARLRQELEMLQAELQNQKIIFDQAGTLAEAAFSLNHVYEAADSAARLYLENIRFMHAKLKERCQELGVDVQEFLNPVEEENMTAVEEDEKPEEENMTASEEDEKPEEENMTASEEDEKPEEEDVASEGGTAAAGEDLVD